ncbi:Scr1 family TA system antitoxin-like transcriptional regulator [Streptomyces sp. V1I1]|uniref:Scr1 family TA system antitoxin-like transcriptional regulator n=1 Tax=Streptomyces sp. V1I1 TaxID=3042272 RepID=UPI002788DFAB|nr:Scr1 family TA system antitoxin-like transcriptional regulator [Streptomyces sp. V1I1]MDQ0940507.1 hypothetical protein [Streptomyces sp. V1I1]
MRCFAVLPETTVPDDVVAVRGTPGVSARLDRKRIFERKPRPMANFLLEEAILHRPIGGHNVLRNQIRHLRQCAELPFLGLQIMPTKREKHAGLAGLTVAPHAWAAFVAQR